MTATSPRLLIVDDDRVTCDLLFELFAQCDYSIRTARSGEAAIGMLAECPADVLVSDIRMKTRVDGLTLLAHARREFPETAVVLMTAFGSIETAIRAVKEGAFDYISKPFDLDALVATVQRAVAARAGGRPVPEEELEDESPRELVGRSFAMLEVYKMIARVADAPTCVLVSGESGTGKELVARAIHRNGARAESPFVAVNCGALAETLLETELFGHVKGAFTGAISGNRGIFERAGDGTVFLDEVSDMSPALQAKLLRVLQEREVVPVGGGAAVRVRARVTSASNRDLETLVREGAFRRDLLYRLNVINIAVPPLRERRDDIPLLVRHLVQRHARPGRREPVLDDEALAVLVAYDWPGNVRELENAVERAITLARDDRITVDDLPAGVRRGPETAPHATGSDPVADTFAGLPSLAEVERRYVDHVLGVTNGNRARAAEILQVHRKTLYRMAERRVRDAG